MVHRHKKAEGQERCIRPCSVVPNRKGAGRTVMPRSLSWRSGWERILLQAALALDGRCYGVKWIPCSLMTVRTLNQKANTENIGSDKRINMVPDTRVLPSPSRVALCRGLWGGLVHVTGD